MCEDADVHGRESARVDRGQLCPAAVVSWQTTAGSSSLTIESDLKAVRGACPPPHVGGYGA